MNRPLQAHLNLKYEDTATRALRVWRRASSCRFFESLLLIVLLMAPGLHAQSVAQTSGSLQDGANSDPAIVALASSFRSLWPALVQAYVQESGNPAPLSSFASSGLLTTQILHGAPFELFLSADKATVQRLSSAGKTQSEAHALAQGPLSIVWRGQDTPTLEQVGELRKAGQSINIAIANPRHAPYGIAAQQALQHAGLWPMPKGSLLSAENASQALQYVLHGAVELAIVPTTLLVGSNTVLKNYPIPHDYYEAVTHHLVVLNSAGEQAIALSLWLKTPQALAIMQRFGLSQTK